MTLLHYLSAPPGSGKTAWTARHIAASAQRRRSVVVFVAPTKEALTQMQRLLVGYSVDAVPVISGGKGVAPVGERLCDALTRAKLGGVLLITSRSFLDTCGSWPEAALEAVELIIDGPLTLTAVVGNVVHGFSQPVWDRMFQEASRVAFRRLEFVRGGRTLAQNSVEHSDATAAKFLKTALNRESVVYVRASSSRSANVVGLRNLAVFWTVPRVLLVGAFLESTEMFHVLRRLGHDLTAIKAPSLVSRDHRFSALRIYPLFDLDRPLTRAEVEWAVCHSAHQGLLTKTYCVDGTLRLAKVLDDIAALTRETRLRPTPYDSDLSAIAEKLTLDRYFHTVWNTHPLFNSRNGPVVRQKVEQLSSSPSRAYASVLSDNCSEYLSVSQLSSMDENPILTEVLTGYDPLAKPVNTLACAVMCTAIRDPSSTEIVNVLVPDRAVAHALRAKFWDKPCVRKLDVFGEYALLGEFQPSAAAPKATKLPRRP